jgi:WD40 repeat protein
VAALVNRYDVPGNRFLPPLVGHDGSIFDLSFSPDSQTLASASADTTVLLWDIAGLAGPVPPMPAVKDRANNP